MEAFENASKSNTAVLPKPARQPKVEQPRLWNVVLLDDQDHSYEYVIEMTQRVFAAGRDRAFEIAKAVDTHGRAVCGTYHRELAELKLEQVHAQGRDPRIASCAGSISATLEPAGVE